MSPPSLIVVSVLEKSLPNGLPFAVSAVPEILLGSKFRLFFRYLLFQKVIDMHAINLDCLKQYLFSPPGITYSNTFVP